MKKSNKKIEIISAVTMLFSHKGYMLSMSEIANKVDIKVASIYTHFNGKDDLIYISIEEEVNRYYNYLDDVILSLKNKSAKESLEKLLKAILDNYDSKEKIKYWNNIHLINDENLSNKCLDLINYKTIIYMKKLKIIFEKGLKNNEIETVNIDGILYLYMSMVEGILKGILIRGEITRDYVPYIWEAYWNGIKKISNF